MSGAPKSGRTPVFTATTPYSKAPTVTLMDNTWRDHIQSRHPEMSGKLSNIQTTLQTPTAVCTASNPDYYTFVNAADTDTLGHPLVVVVSPIDSSGSPVVATAYHSKKHATINPKDKLWP